jgi:phosphatidylglycerophosphate synthase
MPSVAGEAESSARTIVALSGGAALLALTCWALSGIFSLRFPTGAFGVYAPAAVLVFRSAAGPFGWPNRVTLGRLVLTSLVGGLALELTGARPGEAVMWAFVAVAAVALALDGVDGYLARRLNQVSAFGARFDMEVDALLILLLSLVVWMLGKAGAWVLLIGAMRYAFVAAGWLWAALNAPLFPSYRRKAVCVVQGVALAALLAPVLVPPLSSTLALLALAVILYSFAVDVIWLARRDDAA